MQTRVFSSVRDADAFLREEAGFSSPRDLFSSTLVLHSAIVFLAALLAVSLGGHRGVSLLTRTHPELPINVPQ